MTATEDLSEALRSVIERYLEGHRSRSVATLSRASGVSYTTLRRLYQREGNPTAEPVLKIVDAALSNVEKREFIGRFYPEIAITIDRAEGDAPPRPGPRREMLKTFFVRDPHNFILNLAHTETGTTKAAIDRLLGERGLEALAELIEHEIISCDERDGGARYFIAPLVSHDCDMGLAQIKLSADHFDRTLIGTKAARLFHTTATINAAALDQVHDVLSAAILEIVAIKDDPANAGAIPFFADMIMNVYDRATLGAARTDA